LLAFGKQCLQQNLLLELHTHAQQQHMSSSCRPKELDWHCGPLHMGSYAAQEKGVHQGMALERRQLRPLTHGFVAAHAGLRQWAPAMLGQLLEPPAAVLGSSARQEHDLLIVANMLPSGLVSNLWQLTNCHITQGLGSISAMGSSGLLALLLRPISTMGSSSLLVSLLRIRIMLGAPLRHRHRWNHAQLGRPVLRNDRLGQARSDHLLS